MENDNVKHNLLILIGSIIVLLIIFWIFSAIIENDNSDITSTQTYTNYHKCEYPGCDNYASKTKYCSKHNQTKCSKPGCSNKEAYQGAGLCRTHLYQSIQDY